MKSHIRIYSVVLLFVIICSCHNDLDYVLEQAGNNQQELEKVLDHFREDPDTLKYSAAKYLIENILYHYSFSGKDVLRYDSAYIAMSHEPTQYKDSVFAMHMVNFDLNKLEIALDIENITADYLIKNIEEACSIWHSVPWSHDYDISFFYEYVLPYRLLNEEISDWRTLIFQDYPFLFANETRTMHGLCAECEKSKISSCELYTCESASGHQALIFNDTNDSILFDMPVFRSCKKGLYLCYSTMQNESFAIVKLNKQIIDTLYLTPTFSANTFNSQRCWLDIDLPKGNNELVIQHANGHFCLDYVYFTSIEQIDPQLQENFSDSFYSIHNCQTDNVISFDTLSSSLLDTVKLKGKHESDSCTLLRIDCAGFLCWRIATFKNDSIDLCLDVFNNLSAPETPIVQWKYYGGNNQKWVFLPHARGLFRIMSKESGMFLESVADSVNGGEYLIQTTYKDNNSQLWKLSRRGKRTDDNNIYGSLKLNSAIAEAYRVFDIMPLFDWFYFKGLLPPKASSLCKWKTGECRDEANFIVYLCRAKGIPAAVDFTPHWGNRSLAHTWSVLISPHGKAIPFYMGAVPGDTTNLFHGYKKPKVYRRRYRMNLSMIQELKNESSVPYFFKYPNFYDVTSEYCPTTDVTLNISSDNNRNRVAYICVFDNNQWVPVHYGLITDGSVTFTSMGREIVYMVGLWENESVKPISSPFYITGDGSVKMIKACSNRRINLKLNRKYPFMGREDFFNYRMWGGRFQGANTPKFSNATDFYVFNGITNGNWYEVLVNDSGKYKYLRYIGPKGSFCNINELHFYDKTGEEIMGTIIGTTGIDNYNKEKVFDNNILTGFHSVTPDEGWVGIRLSQPKQISKIRFIPRNDGNCIEKGDYYELVYWNNNRWVSLGTQEADNDTILFENVPADALYLLHDLTKGYEERIFTYEKGKQVWW